jgi:type IV secretory pathway component VirB8
MSKKGIVSRQAKRERKFIEKINSTANLTLRKEIFRLARNRDILGVILVVSIILIITLLVLLFKHW